VRSRAEKTFFSFLEEFFGGARKIKNRKESFSARQAAALRRLAAGRSDWFCSEIFAKISSSVVV